MSTPSVFIFKFEGRNVCLFKNELREVEESPSNHGSGATYSVDVDGLKMEVIRSSVPLVIDAEGGSEMARLVSQLHRRVRALEVVVSALDPSGRALLGVENHLAQPNGMDSPSEMDLAQFSSSGSSIAKHEKALVSIASNGEETVLVEFAMDDFDEYELPAPRAPSKNAHAVTGTMNIGSSASPSAAREPTKAEKEALKKAAADRKKAEERAREDAKKQEALARKKAEADKKKAMEDAKRAKQLDAERQRQAAERQRQEALRPKKPKVPVIPENFVLSGLLQRAGQPVPWQPGKDDKKDAICLCLALMMRDEATVPGDAEGMEETPAITVSPLQVQTWVMSKISERSRNLKFKLSTLTKFDPSLESVAPRWSSIMFAALGKHHSQPILFRWNRGNGRARLPPVSVDPHVGAPALRMLTKEGGVEDKTVKRYLQPIHLAARYGSLELLQWCLDHGATVHDKDGDDYNPVHYATLGGHLHVLQALMRMGAAFGKVDYGREHSVAHFACMGGHLHILEWLQEEGIEITEHCDWWTPVQYAAAMGHTDIVRWYVSQKLHTNNLRMDSPPSVAQLAVLRGDTEMLKWLLEQDDAILRMRDGEYLNIAHYAIVSNQFELLQWLHAQGFMPPEQRGDCSRKTYMFLAVSTGNLDMMEWVEKTVGFNHSFATGYYLVTLAHAAAQYGHLEALKWLQSRGCPMLTRDKEGRSILHRSVASGNIELTTWIMSTYVRTCKLFDPANEGLMAPAGETSVPPLTFKDKGKGKYLAHFGARSGSPEMMEFLRSVEVDLTKFDDKGNSLSHYAFQSQSVPFLQWMVSQGLLQRTLKNADGRTPEHFAKSDAVKHWMRQAPVY